MEQTKTISVYSTPTCHFCHMAKDFFTEKGISFTDYNVAEDLAKRSEMVEKTGQLGVPVFSIVDSSVPVGQQGHEELVIGFDQDRLSHILGIR